jgi:hypothetical protein
MYKFVVEKPDRKIIMGDSEDNIKIDKWNFNDFVNT